MENGGEGKAERGAVHGAAILPSSPGAEPRDEGPSNDVQGNWEESVTI